MSSVERDEWMDSDAAAGFLKVCRKTLYRYCATEGLKHSRAGREYRFRRSWVEAWLESRAMAW